MSTSSTDQTSDGWYTLDYWQALDRVHAQLQERTNRYIEQLAQNRDYLEQYVAVLTAMLDSIGDGLIVCDEQGNLVLINDAAERLIGSDIPNQVDNPWPNESYGLFYADTVTRIAEKDRPMKEALKGRTVETVFFVRASNCPDGAWFRVHATPVYDKFGTLHGAIAVFHDITDARKASRQRDALSALITHDLKNHLIGESQLLKLLIDGELGSLNEQQRDLLIRVERDSKRQFQMTKGLVEIFRYDLRSEVLQFIDTDITSVVKQCAEEFLLAAQESAVTLETDYESTLAVVSADVNSLRHVLMNLLGNSLKFTPAGGCIKIQTRNLNHEISISVSDTGSGIAEADLQMLFADVWPVSSRQQAPESTGLGLYLCAKIIEAHKGRISCSSELGAGTTFTLILPSSRQEEP